jgi:hypothetical protein
MILCPQNIDTIVEDSISKGIPLHVAAMEYQREVLEFNFRIERQFGCVYLSSVAANFGDDEELINATAFFMYTAMRR